MPRTAVAAFLGPSNPLRSRTQDNSRTINYYLEPTPPGQSVSDGGWLPTPGLRPFAQINDSPGNASFSQDGREFAIIGTTYAEVFADGTTTGIGTVTPATSDLPALIISNGSAGDQNFVLSGGNGYVHTLSTNAFTIVNNTTFPGTGFPYGECAGIEFVLGWAIALKANSRTWFLSALEDFTDWDPLDVAERSEGSDNLVGVIRLGLNLFFPGTKTGEVWYPNGDALFPWAPVPGVFVESGAASPIMTRVADTVAWITQDERGIGQVALMESYKPKIISDGAVATALQRSTDLSAARLFTQQQDAHTFLWVTIPDLETSWVYDLLTGMWAERALWDTTLCVYEPHLASSYAFAFGKHLVTSRENGVIYALDLTAFNDSVVAA